MDMNIFEKSPTNQEAPKLNPILTAPILAAPKVGAAPVLRPPKVSTKKSPTTDIVPAVKAIQPSKSPTTDIVPAVKAIQPSKSIDEFQFDADDQKKLVSILDDWSSRKKSDLKSQKKEAMKAGLGGVAGVIDKAPHVEQKSEEKKRNHPERKAVIIALNYDGPQFSQSLGEYVTPVCKKEPHYENASKEAQSLGGRILYNNRNNGVIWSDFIKEKYQFKDR